MVTTAADYRNSEFQASYGSWYDGVVLVSAGGYYGTGSLLYDGRAILTAAHLVNDVSLSSCSVRVQNSLGLQSLSVSKISICPEYNSQTLDNDLAIVFLSENAPSAADRYSLYRQGNEIGKKFAFVGYGLPGTGNIGYLENSSERMRLVAQNTFDADMSEIKSVLGNGMTWSPTPGIQLAADFDNGRASQDALGLLVGTTGAGLGEMEGMIAPGDSGGPAFIDYKIAGVASYSASLNTGTEYPDIDTKPNSSFGELGVWQRVSAQQQWVDQTIRAELENTPITASQVSLVVNEAQDAYAYFLVKYNGERSDPETDLRVDYSTRDGSAESNKDYIATSGTLILYPGETQAIIPVEIISDSVSELAETFYLDIFNPIGGNFPGNTTVLSAMRTIVET